MDAKNAVYLENVIPFRDMIAFTCVLKEDMNLIIRYLRTERNLVVNVLNSGNNDLSSYQPKIPIEQLRKYGLYTYLNTLFTAPGPIMNYLCKNYQVHNIPIGTNETSKFYDQIPGQIRVFFSGRL